MDCETKKRERERERRHDKENSLDIAFFLTYMKSYFVQNRIIQLLRVWKRSINENKEKRKKR